MPDLHIPGVPDQVVGYRLNILGWFIPLEAGTLHIDVTTALPSGYAIGRLTDDGDDAFDDGDTVHAFDLPVTDVGVPHYIYAYGDDAYDAGLTGVATWSFDGAMHEAPETFVVYGNPRLAPNAAPLGLLTHAEGRTIRVVHNGVGEGRFSINRHSEQAEWCDQFNYVRVFRPEAPGPVFGFFLETSQDVVVSPDEEGGEFLTIGGRGSMSIFGNFVLQEQSYLPEESPFDLRALPQTDPDGMWHWTRNAGSILVRQLEEMAARDVNPMAAWDFTRDDDSNGDTWASDPDPPKFKLAVGIEGLDMLGQLQQQGLIVTVTPGFLIRAWDTDQGVATGITFERDVNIRESAEREIGASTAASHVLVQGDAASGYRYRLRSDAGIEAAIGKVEAFLEFGATPTNATLDRAGDRMLAQLKRKADGPTTIAVVERTGEVAFVDYRPGDYATVLIPGVWDSVESVIGEILLTESETGEVEAAIQFGGDDPVVSADTPIGSGCGGCAGTCERSETFTDGEDDVVLAEAYMPGSTVGRVTLDTGSGPVVLIIGDDYDETDPGAGEVTIHESQSPGDTLVIPYTSAACMRQHYHVGSAAGAEVGDFMPAFQFADDETPTGTIDGSNAAFGLAHNPSPDASLILVKAGIVQRRGSGQDFTLSGSTVTFVAGNEPIVGDTLRAWYRYT